MYKCPKPKFRIRLEQGKSQFYDVFVFPFKKQMLAYFFRHGGSGSGHFLAITESWMIVHGKRVSPCIGRILICEKACRVGIVSHECTHAATFWAEAQKKDVLRKDNEWFCTVQGELVRQFWNGWARTCLKKKR